MSLIEAEWLALSKLPFVPPKLEAWDVQQRCEDITRSRNVLTRLMDSEQCNEVSDYLTMRYVEEIAHSELDLQLSGEQLMNGDCSAAVFAKVQCLIDALNAFIFAPVDFSRSLMKPIHEHLMAYNPAVAGCQRTRNAKPANTDYAYSLPSQIDRQLNELYTFVAQTKASLSPDNVEQSIKLGALFFNAFLRTHPYSNGNGRLARVLTNILLREICPVPFSFFSTKRNRATYLASFENRKGEPPIAMASYLFAAVWEQSIDLIRQTDE